MLYRDYGNNGFQVSVLGFGASHIGSDQCTEQGAEKILNTVLDHGVTLIDTARGYGYSEDRIGKYISHRRDEYILSTKCGYGIEGVQDWTPECITQGVDYALKLMKTDYIDIMHFHSCEVDVLKNDDLRGALLKAKEQGKIRVAAYSGENEHRKFALDCEDFTGIQTSMNICDQRVIDEALPTIREKKYGLIAKRPIANAFWRFDKQPEGDYCEQYWLRAKEMNLQPPQDMSWIEFALRFTAFQEGLSSMIIGTRSMDHFLTNIKMIEKGALANETIKDARDKFKQADNEWVGLI